MFAHTYLWFHDQNWDRKSSPATNYGLCVTSAYNSGCPSPDIYFRWQESLLATALLLTKNGKIIPCLLDLPMHSLQQQWLFLSITSCCNYLLFVSYLAFLKLPGRVMLSTWQLSASIKMEQKAFKQLYLNF